LPFEILESNLNSISFNISFGYNNNIEIDGGEKNMLKEQDMKIIRYMVACVNEFAERFNINGREAFNYLNSHKAINFLLNNYEIEHTLSIDDAVEDMVIISRNNGGNI
jgi:hypothetical protein